MLLVVPLMIIMVFVTFVLITPTLKGLVAVQQALCPREEKVGGFQRSCFPAHVVFETVAFARVADPPHLGESTIVATFSGHVP